MVPTFPAIDQQSRPALCRAGGLTSGPAKPDGLEPLKRQAITVRAGRGEEIVAQGQAAGYCYLVVSGCVRTINLMEDGRRQIGAFLHPGDLFGWETLDEHDFGAEAVTPATLRRYPRRSLEQIAELDRDFARGLRELAAAELRAGRQHIVLLGRKRASERIASFLLEMAERISPDERGEIELPMGRADMADYLGLTVETVCRSLTQLRRRGTIAVERAKVVIRDRRALGMAGCEVVR